MTYLYRQKQFIKGAGITNTMWMKSNNQIHQVQPRFVNGKTVYAPVKQYSYKLAQKPVVESNRVVQTKAGHRTNILNSISKHLEGGMIRMY